MSTKTTDTVTGLTAPAAAGKTFDTVLADLALAAANVDIAASYADGTPVESGASGKLDWSKSLAFQNATLDGIVVDDQHEFGHD